MKFNLVFLGKTKPPSFITICGAFQRQEPILVHIQTQEKVLLNSKLPYTSKQVLLRRKTDSSAGASSAVVSSTRSSSVLARALKQPTPMKTKPKNDQHFPLSLKINKRQKYLMLLHRQNSKEQQEKWPTC